MDSIVVGFSKPNGWFEPFSWLIRLMTWCSFSHAYIKYYNSYADRWITFQASGLAVNFMGQIMFDGKEDIYAEFEIPISEATKLKTVQFAIDNVGAPYAIGQILGFPIVWFMSWFGKKISNPLYSGSNYFCSELVSDVINEIEAGKLNASVMTPKDLYNWIVSKGYQKLPAG